MGIKTADIPAVEVSVAWVQGGSERYLRHQAKNEDGTSNWGWGRHDGRGFGVSNITDRHNNFAGTMAYMADNAEDAATRSGAWTMAFEGSCAPGKVAAHRLKSRTAPANMAGDMASPLSIFLAVTARGKGTIEVDDALTGPWRGTGAGGDVYLRVKQHDGMAEGLIVVPSMAKSLWNAVAGMRPGSSPDNSTWAADLGTRGASPADPLLKSHRYAPLWSTLSNRDSFIAETSKRALPAWAQRLHVKALHLTSSSELWRIQDQLREEVRSSSRRALYSFRDAAGPEEDERSSVWRDPGSYSRATRIVPVLNSTARPSANMVLVQAVVPACNAALHAAWLPVKRSSRDKGEDGEQAGQAWGAEPAHAAIAAALAKESAAALPTAQAASRALLGPSFWRRVASRARGVDERVRQVFGTAPDDDVAQALRSNRNNSSNGEGEVKEDDAESEQAGPRRRRATRGRRLRSSADGSKAAMVRYAVGNLAGSVTLYTGRQYVRGEDGEAKRSDPMRLLTGCPSRSLFPRGFFWDEGFHQLLLARYDPRRSADVLSSWFRTADETGWIAREQILGPEAESRVPHQFRVQRRDVANPPTPLLAIQEMLQRLGKGSEVARWEAFRGREARRWQAEFEFVQAVAYASGDAETIGAAEATLKAALVAIANEDGAAAEAAEAELVVGADGEAAAVGAAKPVGESALDGLSAEAQQWVVAHYEPITRYYRWLRESQRGPNGRGFQWKGDKPGDGGHTFASGLDDYPRGSWHTASDRHVDLTAWVAWAAGLMRRMAGAIGRLESAPKTVAAAAAKDALEFAHDEAAALAAVDDHWNEEEGVFCDIALPQSQRREVEKGRIDPADDSLPLGHVCHEGYVSVFPLLLGLVRSDSPRLPRLLAPLLDGKRMLSPSGLRSLSKSSPLFMTGENYWRGKVWANINFLAVKALDELAAQGGPSADDCAAVARRIRHGMSLAVHREWERTSTLWENYDAEAGGRGAGTHPFTGWTALVAAMMPEQRSEGRTE
ncbi:hypothetical protein FNF28_01110 [Cafeteria roenbergensis]|uniref:Mannosyl-oligosaccharide glucosidase n=1 Tax=Cafeteria roenbergensis TaxID=33653 RepID=A0A5A8E1Y9_CAFRO|nr:hypothetical protein FNF28_01110 [Cafeteria roenbergensis]